MSWTGFFSIVVLVTTLYYLVVILYFKALKKRKEKEVSQNPVQSQSKSPEMEEDLTIKTNY